MGIRRGSIPASGVYAALATPRRPDSIDADAALLLDYLDAVVAAGVEGVVLFGSTGEFVHFDVQQRMRLLMLVIKRCRTPLLVNVSHSTLSGALELADSAVAADASGVLLMPPYFYRYTDGQVRQYYLEFAAAIGGQIPIYLYNLPCFTNPISADLARELLESGYFAGIKDSSGDWQLFQTLNALRSRPAFKFLVGNERLYARARSAGADGIVSGVAAAVPELIVSLDRALRTGDLDRAQVLDSRLAEFLAFIDRFPATIGIKQAAVARGWNLDHSAIPLDEHTAAELAEFRQWFREWFPCSLSQCRELAATRK